MAINEIMDSPGPEKLQEVDVQYSSTPKTKLATGIDILDRNLNGGIPLGSLVYFSAYPMSMPDVFMYELSTPRKTYYFTTDKDPRHIVRNMVELDFEHSNVEFIDVHDYYYNKLLSSEKDKQIAASKTIQYMNEYLDMIKYNGEKNITIILDSFSFLLDISSDMDTLKRLLDKIYDIVDTNESVCYLMIVKGAHAEPVESRIQNWCDVIFDIDLERKGDKIVNKLTLPKIRGMAPLVEYIKFKVTDRITIDTSRDIA